MLYIITLLVCWTCWSLARSLRHRSVVEKILLSNAIIRKVINECASEGNILVDLRAIVSAGRKECRSVLFRRALFLSTLVFISALTDVPIVVLSIFYLAIITFQTVPSHWGFYDRVGQTSLKSVTETNYDVLATISAMIIRATTNLCSVWMILLSGRCDYSDGGLYRWLLAGIGLTGLYQGHRIPAMLLQTRRKNSDDRSMGFSVDADETSIVYLRSFDDDRLKIPSIIIDGPAGGFFKTKQSFEHIIAKLPDLYGCRLVAIGRPGERFMPLGAVRTYYPDDEWQSAVETSVHRAKAIVLIAGSTTGLDWEIKHLREWRVLDKCLVILPPIEDFDESYERYQHVHSLLAPNQSPISDDIWMNGVFTALRGDGDGVIEIISRGRDDIAYVGTMGYFLESLEGGLPLTQNGDSPVRSSNKFQHVSYFRTILIQSRLRKALTLSDSVEAWRSIIELARSEPSPVLSAWILRVSLDVASKNSLTEQELISCEAIIDVTKADFRQARIPYYGLINCDRLRIEATKRKARISASEIGKKISDTEEWYEASCQGERWHDAGMAALSMMPLFATISDISRWHQYACGAFRRIGDLRMVGVADLQYAKLVSDKESDVVMTAILRNAIHYLDSAGETELLCEARQRLNQLGRMNFKISQARCDTLLDSVRYGCGAPASPEEEESDDSRECPAVPGPDALPSSISQPWKIGTVPIRTELKSELADCLEIEFLSEAKRNALMMSMLISYRLPLLRGVMVRLAKGIAMSSRAVVAAAAVDAMHADLLRDVGNYEAALSILESIVPFPALLAITLSDSGMSSGVELMDEIAEAKIDCLMQLGDTDAAISVAFSRIDLAEEYFTFDAVASRWGRFGVILRESGYADKAIRAFSNSSMLGCVDDRLWLQWCAAAMETGDFESAKKFVEASGLSQEFDSDVIIPNYMGMLGDFAILDRDVNRARMCWRKGLAACGEWDFSVSLLLRGRLEQYRHFSS